MLRKSQVRKSQKRVMTNKFVASEPIKCPKCKSEHIVKHGYHVTLKGKFPRRKCQNCGTTFYKNKEGNDG